MDFGLNIEQKQITSYKTILSSEILQMPYTDLEHYLYEQTLDNPILDIMPAYQNNDDPAVLEINQRISSHDEPDRYHGRIFESSNNDTVNWVETQENQETLQNHLWSQLLTRFWPNNWEIPLRYILDSLDEKGYFIDSLELLTKQYSFSIDQAEEMLTLVQSLNPAGIGARNLEECLCLQLSRQGILTSDFQTFIHSNLNLIIKNQLAAITRNTGLPLSTVKNYFNIIQSLNPWPGALFSSSEKTLYITPDVTVINTENGFEIQLNDSIIPKIIFNDYYIKLYEESENNEVHDYLQKKIQQAKLLEQCIQQRYSTLTSIIKTLLNMQQEFFHNGPSYLKPLKQSDVADILGIHVSTISRACNQKYLRCSWGTFQLNHFFVRAASVTKSDSTTSLVTTLDVKQALCTLIEQEDKSKPYSDRILAELLSQQGFQISRRTITKYRKELSIPGTTGRKIY
ncbi:RNA polymerase factor sigma-54 [Vallitalea guaymasensis]|uniref:RNA polymerase factor sigma-54 n=1 Tax=Vallitalea guaymasensis TaxID=1185412 RepID=UPI00187D386E|nr:RNA polymerase factor sigma-54 [Vallitalea guaymasensis]